MTFDELLGSEFGPPAADGAHIVRLPLRDEHHGVHGFVHGGVLCSLAHQSAGAAVYAGCKAGEEAVMLEMKINFVAASWTGTLESRSQVIRRGSRVALVETRITGDDGALRATVSSTFLLLTRALRPAE
jgi:acyl-CoA thioesterase